MWGLAQRVSLLFMSTVMLCNVYYYAVIQTPRLLVRTQLNGFGLDISKRQKQQKHQIRPPLSSGHSRPSLQNVP